MGNLIKDFWTYQYKERNYYGICEVVAGEDLKQQRHIKRYETHIEKALEYMMEPNNKFVSHISIQKYLNFTGDKVHRTEDEETFYPFFFEFEPKMSQVIENTSVFKEEYKNAVGEALRVVKYSIHMLGVDERDILIMINNSRSIYVMFNPRIYGLRPNNRLHMIYKEMYKAINDEMNLKYVDAGLYNSYGLMKTPNCYYKGGYFVCISVSELEKLYINPGLKQTLTANKRSLDYTVPAVRSSGLTKLYQEALETIQQTRKVANSTKYQGNDDNNQVTFITKCSSKCVEYIENNMLEQGPRNHALVSVAIYYKNIGYTAEQIEDKLIDLASKWGHDEGVGDIKSKVKSVFRYNYRFSCNFAKEMLGLEMESLCSNCPFNASSNEKLNKTAIQADIINELWENKASVRHYIAYLELSKNRLFNRWIDPKEEGINDRTVRELCNLSKNLTRERAKGLIYIKNKAEGNIYYLPNSFFVQEAYLMLGEHLKHYLKILIKGYKTMEQYIKLRVSKEKIKKDLDYKDISSVYKLIKKLKELGFLIVKHGKLIALHYTSYKIKDLQEYREGKERRDINRSSYRLVVNGGHERQGEHRQLSFHIPGSSGSNGSRGSPG